MIRNAPHVNPPRFLHAKTVANPNHSTKIESFTFTCLATLYIHLYSFIKPFPFFNPILPPPLKTKWCNNIFVLVVLTSFFFLITRTIYPCEAKNRRNNWIVCLANQWPIVVGGEKRKKPIPKIGTVEFVDPNFRSFIFCFPHANC